VDDLLSDFLTETNESLAELDGALLTLERTPDDAETLGFIFRLVHTIKGTCGFLGLPRLERVAHAGENVLGKLRDRTLTVTPDIVTQVLAGIDQIKAIVAHLSATGVEPPGDDTDLIAALNLVASRDAPAAGRPPPPVQSPLSARLLLSARLPLAVRPPKLVRRPVLMWHRSSTRPPQQQPSGRNPWTSTRSLNPPRRRSPPLPPLLRPCSKAGPKVRHHPTPPRIRKPFA
jgi:two-component system, chemotaxis family, sensor kinase CheA